MEKIKSLLNPGHKADADTLYGSGQGQAPVVNSLADQHPHHHGLQSSATSPPKPLEDNGPTDEAPTADVTDHARGTQNASIIGGDRDYTSSTSGRNDATQADAKLLATRESDRLAGGQHDGLSGVSEDRSHRPQFPVAGSAASNASIKSNVIGKTPSGTAYGQTGSELPPVPATDGKFMNVESPGLGESAPYSQTSSVERSLPLVGSHASSDSARQTSPPFQTALASRLGLNRDSTSDRLHTTDGRASEERTQEGHVGRNTTVLGTASAAVTGLFARTGGNDQPPQATSESHSHGGSSSFAPALSALTGDRDTSGHSSTQSQADSSKFASALSPITGSGVSGTSAGSPTKGESSEFAPALSAITEPSSHHTSAVGSSVGSSAERALPSASYGAHESTGSTQMPGAYPETPAIESNKTLGSDVTGVGSDAAVIAAQKAYGQPSSGHATGEKAKTQAPPKPVTQTPAYVPTHKVEPSPYGHGIDPRIAPNSRSDATRSTAGVAAGVGAATGVTAGALAGQKSASPQGTLGEKIQEAQAHESQRSVAPIPAASAPSYAPSHSGGPLQTHQSQSDVSPISATPASSTVPSLGGGIGQTHETQRAVAPTSAPTASSIPPDTEHSSVQGTHFEKAQDTNVGDDDHTSRYALAGAAAAATGAGAHGVSQHRNDDLSSNVRHDFNSIREEPVSDRSGSVSAEHHPHARSEPIASAHDQADSTRANDNIVAGGPIASSTEHNISGQRSTEREFPLSTSHHEQNSAAKATNFSYPTGAKESLPQTGGNLNTAPRTGQRTFPAETGAAGVGGLAAYEAVRHEQQDSSIGHSSDFDDPLASRAHPGALGAYDDQRAVPTHDVHTTGHEPVVRHSEPEASHGHRDAALGAGAVGGGAAAGVLGSQHVQDDRLEQERAKTAERKHAEHEKYVRKSEDKPRHSEDKSRPKTDDKESKHGLLHRILHRKKSKDSLDKENEPRGSSEKVRSSLDRPSYDQAREPVGETSRVQSGGQLDDPAGLQSSGYTGDSSLDGNDSEHLKHGRHVLHKDPPASIQSKLP